MSKKNKISNSQKRKNAFFGLQYIATAKNSKNNYFLSELIIEKKDIGPPFHIHRYEDEAFYIIEGRLTFFIKNKRIQLKTGEYLRIPKNTKHRYQNYSNKKVKTLILFSPTGIEKMFKEMDKLIKDEDANNPTVLNKISLKYGTLFFENGEKD
jgi:quercetin dioxygenase-like cupin family protein